MHVIATFSLTRSTLRYPGLLFLALNTNPYINKCSSLLWLSTTASTMFRHCSFKRRTTTSHPWLLRQQP